MTDLKRIPLNRLLMLQMAYCFAGLMYNVGSLLALRNGQLGGPRPIPSWAWSVRLFLSTGLMKSLISFA